MSQYNMDPTKGGIKHDQDKTQWHLLPMEAVEGAVRVMMHGAKKYSAYNWANGMPYTRVLDAAVRHINSIYQGEDKDPDSQLDHVDHAICELMFLKYYMIHGVGEDDRFKRGQNNQQPQSVATSGFVQSIYFDPTSYSNRYYALAPPATTYPGSLGAWLDELERSEGKPADIPHEDSEGDPNYWGV